MTGIWLSETQFIEIDDRASLAKEIAPRSRSVDWMGVMALLPDPDPVLQKAGIDMATYRQLLTDGHVWSGYTSRKSGTLSLEGELSEAEGAGARPARRALELVKDAMAGLDLYTIISDMLEAVFFGMSPCEVVWRAGSQWLPERIEGKPPEWFGFDDENRLRFLSREHQVTGEEIPDAKFLLPRHHPSYRNPYGERALARCFWPVVFKKGGFKFWAIFTEKYGMPWVIGRVPRRTNDTERTALLANLKSMVQDAVAVVNDDETIEIKESGGKTASAQVYEKLVSAANREISKAILGQTLSTELDKGGSYAAARSHLEVRADLIDQDKRMVKAELDRLFRWITELNLGTPDAAPEWKWFEEEDLQADRAERDGKLTTQGVRFTSQYYERTYNLEPGDFELTEPGRMPGPGTIPGGAGFEEQAAGIPGQDDVDRVMLEAAQKSGAHVEAMVEQAISKLADAETLEEAGERLYALFPELDEGRFQEILTRALFAGAATGGASVSEESE